jgi:hypothetical protein
MVEDARACCCVVSDRICCFHLPLALLRPQTDGRLELRLLADSEDTLFRWDDLDHATRLVGACSCGFEPRAAASPIDARQFDLLDGLSINRIYIQDISSGDHYMCFRLERQMVEEASGCCRVVSDKSCCFLGQPAL